MVRLDQDYKDSYPEYKQNKSDQFWWVNDRLRIENTVRE